MVFEWSSTVLQMPVLCTHIKLDMYPESLFWVLVSCSYHGCLWPFWQLLGTTETMCLLRPSIGVLQIDLPLMNEYPNGLFTVIFGPFFHPLR